MRELGSNPATTSYFPQDLDLTSPKQKLSLTISYGPRSGFKSKARKLFKFKLYLIQNEPQPAEANGLWVFYIPRKKQNLSSFYDCLTLKNTFLVSSVAFIIKPFIINDTIW